MIKIYSEPQSQTKNNSCLEIKSSHWALFKRNRFNKNLPELLLHKSFPGLTPDQVLTKFKKMDQDMLIEVAGNLLVAVPEQALRFISALISVEYEQLRDDPDIGLNGIKDIIKEFWKINDMQSFFSDVRRAISQSSLMKQMNTGSKS